MPSPQPNPPSPQGFNDLLARMMQAEVNEGGPPPATPCDTPAEVIAHIHMAEPEPSAAGTGDPAQNAKQEFVKTLTEQLERLRHEIHETRTKGPTLPDAAQGTWSETMSDLESKHKAARDKLDAMATSTGAAWERLRNGVTNAWDELQRAVRKARSGV